MTTDEFIAARFRFSLASDGQTSAVIRHSWTQPPEIWAGAVGQWKQMTHANHAMHPAWGEMKSLHWTSDGMRFKAGWCIPPITIRAAAIPWSWWRTAARQARSIPAGRMNFFNTTGALRPRIFRFLSQSSRQLRTGREIYPSQRQRFRLRRFSRHHGGRRRSREDPARGQRPYWHYRLELWRIHDHVGGHADQSFSCGGCRRRHRRTGRVITAKTTSTNG